MPGGTCGAEGARQGTRGVNAVRRPPKHGLEKSPKQSWNVIDSKSLLFLESPQSWNVYENKQVLRKSWNVQDK
jgi:hypothetical protein